MTTKEDIEKEINRRILSGEPGIWSLLAQIEEEPRKKRRSPLWWVLVVLLIIGAGVLLGGCNAMRKAQMERPKSR